MKTFASLFLSYSIVLFITYSYPIFLSHHIYRFTRFLFAQKNLIGSIIWKIQ